MHSHVSATSGVKREDPLVTAIIPAYNAEAFVVEAIDSALSQTHRPLEVVVVNDGSTDQTPRLLEGYGDQIQVVHQANAGLASARNAGAQAARGDWLAFLDADDLWLPEKIERQVALTSPDVGLIYTDRYNWGDRGDLPEVHGAMQAYPEGDIFVALLLGGNFLTASSAMIRRGAFQELGGFSTEVPSVEDYDLWLRFAASGQVRVVREPLVRYRFHGENMSRQHKAMAVARRHAIRRALLLPRGQALPASIRRRARAQVWMSNGSDAARQRDRLNALGAFARAACLRPFYLSPYKKSAKVLLGIA